MDAVEVHVGAWEAQETRFRKWWPRCCCEDHSHMRSKQALSVSARQAQ